MTTNQVGSVGENWMIEAAAEAAPPLASEQIDQLRRVLAPNRTAAPTWVGDQQRRAA